MPDPHISEKCDHIITIAEKHGYKDWNTVWDANKDLQNFRERKNPLVLFTGDFRWDGDEIELPPKKEPDFKQPTDKDGKYEVPKETKLCVRLRILKADFTPIKEADFELAVTGGKTYKGKTTDKGRVLPDGKDPEIPKTCTKATLAVRVAQEETDAGSQDSGKGGGDKKKDAPALKGDCRLKWTLQIGRLNPVMEKAHTKYCISGVQQRLNNLGFYCGPVDGIKGPNTKYAIEKFQSLFGLKVDNIPGTKETQPKLQEIHDTDKAVTIREGEKKPTKTEVKPKEFRKTTPADVGHVAADFVDSKDPFVNTLVVAPEYRIKLDLGKIEDLFLHRPEDIKGQMERLQVLGLFYFPLNHKKAWDQAKKDANKEPSEAGLFAWNYYRHEIGGKMNELEDRVQKFVVDGGKLPPPGPEGNNKPGKKHYAKIRVPGGYTYIDDNNTKFHPNDDPKYRNITMDIEHLPNAEKMVCHDNPVVGAIPLKALVESRYGSSGKWKPAKDVMVYFQLVKPYDLPDYDDKVSPGTQINRPPLRPSDMQTGTNAGKGPAKLDGEVTSGLGDDDPQKLNCHKDHGGYGGEATVLGNVFENKVDLSKYGDAKDEKWRPGFYEAHTGLRKDVVKEPFMEKPEDAAPEGAKYKHAVRAKTNKDGYAGVIFKPSRKGGDRYRLRVFVGPPTLPGNDGTGPDAVVVETGTLVVWRNVRVSKIRQMPCNDVANVVQTQIVEQTKGTLGKIWHKLTSATKQTLMFTTGITNKKGAHVGYSTVDVSAMGDSKCAYDGFVKQMAQAFCEVELDQGADTSEEVTDDEWQEAVDAAIKFAKSNNVAGTQTIDVEKLVIRDTAKLKGSNSFVLIPLRTPKVYNAMLPKNDPKRIKMTDGSLDDDRDLDEWFDECLLYPFIHRLADRGYLPGLFMLQMPTISTWHYIELLSDYAIGVGYRACIMNKGRDVYPYAERQTVGKSLLREGMKLTKKQGNAPPPAQAPWGTYYGTAVWYDPARLDDFGYSALMAHEWGHCLFHTHAPPRPAAGATAIHDPKQNGYCVMTYLPDEGDFCAKCVFALRGWTKIDSLP